MPWMLSGMTQSVMQRRTTIHGVTLPIEENIVQTAQLHILSTFINICIHVDHSWAIACAQLWAIARLGRFLILFFFFSVARFVALLVWALVLQMRPLVCHSWQKNRPAP